MKQALIATVVLVILGLAFWFSTRDSLLINDTQSETNAQEVVPPVLLSSTQDTSAQTGSESVQDKDSSAESREPLSTTTSTIPKEGEKVIFNGSVECTSSSSALLLEKSGVEVPKSGICNPPKKVIDSAKEFLLRHYGESYLSKYILIDVDGANLYKTESGDLFWNVPYSNSQFAEISGTDRTIDARVYVNEVTYDVHSEVELPNCIDKSIYCELNVRKTDAEKILLSRGFALGSSTREIRYSIISARETGLGFAWLVTESSKRPSICPEVKGFAKTMEINIGTGEEGDVKMTNDCHSPHLIGEN